MPNFTNKHSLPNPLVSAIKHYFADYDQVGDISVTGLIKPPRMRILEKRHDDEITVDASEFLYALQGLSIHAILEKADTFNHLSEERMTMGCNGWTVSGKPDLLSPDMVLDDYKVTSVYAFLLGEKIEWTQQLNLYNLLYTENGFTPTKLRITGILRDWVKRRAMQEKGYPKAGVVVREVGQWKLRQQQQLLLELVKDHGESENLKDEFLPSCTPEERWERPTQYAVMKKGNKRATRVFDNQESAYAFKGLTQKDSSEVVERKGESIRCKFYCRAMPFCNQAQTMGVTPESVAKEEA